MRTSAPSRPRILQQVPEPLGALGQELAGVGDFDVLGEHQDRYLGQLGTDRPRGPQSLVGVGRRHPHVDHGDVGLWARTLRSSSSASAAWPTTSRSASSSSRTRPSRSRVESSATTTRMGSSLRRSSPGPCGCVPPSFPRARRRGLRARAGRCQRRGRRRRRRPQRHPRHRGHGDQRGDGDGGGLLRLRHPRASST